MCGEAQDVRLSGRSQPGSLPPSLRSRIKSAAPMKFTFPLRSDSVTDFLGESCYPRFSAEKMETEKRSGDLPSSQRQDVAEQDPKPGSPILTPALPSPALRPPRRRRAAEQRMWPRFAPP